MDRGELSTVMFQEHKDFLLSVILYKKLQATSILITGEVDCCRISNSSVVTLFRYVRKLQARRNQPAKVLLEGKDDGYKNHRY